jgi:hypothetical protein
MDAALMSPPLSATTCPVIVPVSVAWATVMAVVVAALTGPTKKATAIIEASAARINVRTLCDAPSGKYGKAAGDKTRPGLLEKTREPGSGLLKNTEGACLTRSSFVNTCTQIYE